MTKEEKVALVQELQQKLEETPNIYVANTDGLTVEEVNELRGLCFKAGIEMRMIKNTLIKKAMESNSSEDLETFFEQLKQPSSVFFTGEEVNAPAKVIKKFRESHEMPLLKAAMIGGSVYVGDDSLGTLAKLKSKNELIAEVIALLQSPAKNVVGALQSGGNTLSGLLKALGERSE